MEKIKLYFLIAAALFAGSTMAADVTLFTTNFSTADGWSTESIITSSQTTNTKVIKGTTISFKGHKNSDLTVAVGKTEDANGTLTFTGNNLSASAGAASAANYYMAIPVSNVNGTLTVTTTGDATKWYYSYDDGNKGTIVERAQASENRKFTITGLINSDVTVYIGSNAKKMNSITFTTPEKIATTEPSLKFIEESVTLNVSPYTTTAVAELTLKGENLAEGTYNLTMPTVTGLTITPTSVTVAAEGTLNETITLSYTSDVNVEAASTELALTIGELTASTTINYAARVEAFTQTIVTDSTTWDWTKASTTTEIKLTTDTKPTKNDTILLANYEGITNDETFRSDALMVCGEYLQRDSKLFQGGYISFNAERKGFVTVNYSNTGSNAARSLVVNGTKDAAVSSADSKTVQTSSKMSVNAGKVVIMFAETADDTNATKYARVYSITYTVDKSGDIGSAFDQTQVETKALKVLRDGQLLIIREGKTYTAQGVQVQ